MTIGQITQLSANFTPAMPRPNLEAIMLAALISDKAGDVPSKDQADLAFLRWLEIKAPWTMQWWRANYQAASVLAVGEWALVISKATD
jgi:hypothetical protein